MESSKRRKGSLYQSVVGNNYCYESSYGRTSIRNNRGLFRSRNGYLDSRNCVDFLAYLVFFFTSLCSLNCGNSPHETGPSVDDQFPCIKSNTLLPECACEVFEEFITLLCKNVTDFKAFTKILEDGSLFQNGTKYDITLSGTRIVPRMFLKGLNVNDFFIDDPQIECLEDGAFTGVLLLRSFHVWISSIREIPDFRPIRHSLQIMKLDNSHLTTVQGDHLKNLMFLENLSFVNNFIKHVAADAFQGTENVIYFDISYNHLQYLPPHLFDSWKKLKRVVISNNRLLHVNKLFAVTHPKFIYLDHNELTDLDTVLHRNMSQVEMIQLSNNPFSNVTMNSFNGKLTNSTRFLYLDHCKIQDFDVKHYASLHNLSTLDLSYNLIKEVVIQNITFGKDVELYFTGNNIMKFTAKLPYSVKTVNLAENRIPGLQSLQFCGVHGIIRLSLQENSIRNIQRETFNSIRKDLNSLDLSSNKIRRLNGCVRSLSSLISLNLKDNQILSFERGEFEGLNNLTDLYLEWNLIKTLGHEVQRLSSLKFLAVSHNRIRTIKVEQLPLSLQNMHVEGNPLECDCQILPFLEHVNSTNLNTNVPLCIPSNHTPPVPPARCPDGCRCFCTTNAGDYYISVDCSSIGLTQLSPLFAAINSSSTFDHNSTSVVIFLPRKTKENTFFSASAPFVIHDMVKGLNFSYNNLQSMEDARLPKGTKYLLLDHNQLRPPPTSLLYSLKELNTVTLSGNPWTCDCETIGFKKWILSQFDFILDVNETRCGPDEKDSPQLEDRVIKTLTDTDLCPSVMGVYVSIILGVLSFFLAASGVIIAWTRYEINIKVWLYAHGVTWVKERDIDRDKLFDAFISFSYKDQNLVIPELINEMQEREPRVRLCLHYKDFLPGNLIEENIITAVECSKRTVLVLSRNFLESEWCIFEFQAAHVQVLKDRINRIIIIKLGDLPKESEMPKEIQMYLKNTTYLTWGDKYFWNKLLYCLPTSTSPRPNAEDVDNAGENCPLLV